MNTSDKELIMLSDEDRVILFKYWKGIDIKVGDYFPDDNLESLDALMAIVESKCNDLAIYWQADQWEVYSVQLKENYYSRSLVEALLSALLSLAKGEKA